MPEYVINGIPVNFPYEPYDVQSAYMEKVIECLKKGMNGMLESPTGTGKTLSLLCASLGWLTKKKADQQAEAHGLKSSSGFIGDFQEILGESADLTALPGSSTIFGYGGTKIIYASRTHSQLTQAVQELKKTGYGYVKTAVLGSRDQMCIHPEVSKEPNNVTKMHMCQSLTKSQACYFYTNFERKKDDPELRNAGILDIEDLVKLGNKRRVCPYFLARELQNEADIIFMPYNYILDHKHKKVNEVEIMNSVVILDEAHNVEKMCEESVSIQIRSTDIALCIEEVTQVMKKVCEDVELNTEISQNEETLASDFSPQELYVLKAMFLELENAIDDIAVQSGGSTFPGGYIIDLLAKAEITHEKSSLLIDFMLKLIQYLSISGNSPFLSKGAAMQKIVDLLKIVFRTTNTNRLAHVDQLKRCFKVHITEEEPKTKQRVDSWDVVPTSSTLKGKIISYLCFSPGFGMNQLLENNIHCVILTSGTLSPMSTLVSELNIPIPVMLENPHVIGPGQVYVSVVSAGPDGHVLNSSFNTRNDPRYISSLGMMVLNVCRVTPHGLLVFFPSYSLMYKCQEEWQQSGLWSKIANVKPIFVESKNRENFSGIISEYYNKVQDPVTRGACFMAVTRGKVSEGLDFMDVNGRAVIVIGLPFPPMMDVYVKLKRLYLQENQGKNGSQCLTSDQWYLFEASRAVNQAIGRVIRHKNDYGAILLCDTRFDGASIKKALSSWVQPYIKKHNSFGLLIRDLRQFFVNAEKTLPPPRLKAPPCELGAIGPVSASFDVATPSHLYSAKNRCAETASTSSMETPQWSPEEYLSKDVDAVPKKEEKGLFDALEKPSLAINFNDTRTAPVNKSLFKWSDSQEPKTKKLKLKVIQPNRVTSQESSNDCNGTTSKVQSKPTEASLTPGVASSSNSIDENSLEAIKTYALEVKKCLGLTLYQKFRQMTVIYEKKKDLDFLIKILWKLMMGNERNLLHLFKGYRRFLPADHQRKFDEFCSTKLEK